MCFYAWPPFDLSAFILKSGLAPAVECFFFFPFQFLIVETIVIICHHIYHIRLHRYLDNAIVTQQMRQTIFCPFCSDKNASRRSEILYPSALIPF